MSTRTEYGRLGLKDWTAEILDSKFENFTGLGIAQQTGEQEPYHRDDIEQAKQVTITPVKFTSAISISEEINNKLAFLLYFVRMIICHYNLQTKNSGSY